MFFNFIRPFWSSSQNDHPKSREGGLEAKCEVEPESEMKLGTMEPESESTQVCVGVLGAANAGKSTLLNMLLGEGLLPSSAGIETASICHITHDPRLKGEYHCSEDGSANRKTFLSAKDVTKWLKVINKRSDIPDVHVKTAIKLLDGSSLDSKVNLKLIDVPGANEADNDKAREKIGSVLQTCNLILLIVKHEDVGTETVVQLAEMIRQNGRENSPVFVLVNKMDSIAEESERKKVQDIATQAYLDNTSLFGNRSVRIAFTKGKIGLASLCNGNNCREDCPLPNAMLAVISSMSNEEKIPWFGKLAMLHKTNERSEPEGEDPSDPLQNNYDLHREMQARVAEFSGITPLYEELLRLLLVSINTIGVHVLSSKGLNPDDESRLLTGCGELSSLCKEMEKEKELRAFLALVCAQRSFVVAIKHHEKLAANRTDALDTLIESWEAAEKIWHDAIKIFLSEVGLACSQPEQPIATLLAEGVLSLGVKMLSPAGSRNQMISPEFKILITDLQDYVSFQQIGDVLIRLDGFEKGNAAIREAMGRENCNMRSELTLVLDEVQSQILQVYKEFLNMGTNIIKDIRGARFHQDALQNFSSSFLSLSKWCNEMHTDKNLPTFLTLVRGKHTLTMLKKFLSNRSHGVDVVQNTWPKPNVFDDEIDSIRIELLEPRIEIADQKLSHSGGVLLENLLQYKFFGQNNVQTTLFREDSFNKGLAAVASSGKNVDLFWKEQLDYLSNKFKKNLSTAREEFINTFLDFFENLFKDGLRSEIESKLKEECKAIVERCKTMKTEQELRKFLILVKVKDTLQLLKRMYPQCEARLMSTLEISLFPELRGSQENLMKLLHECIMLVGCRMLQPSKSNLPWGLGFKVSGNLELKGYSLPENFLRNEYYQKYSAVLFTILASFEFFEGASYALSESTSKSSSPLGREIAQIHIYLRRSYTNSIENYLEHRLSGIREASLPGAIEATRSIDEEAEISRHIGISEQVGTGLLGAALGAVLVGGGAALAGPAGFALAAEAAVGMAAGGGAGVAGILGLLGAYNSKQRRLKETVDELNKFHGSVTLLKEKLSPRSTGKIANLASSARKFLQAFSSGQNDSRQSSSSETPRYDPKVWMKKDASVKLECEDVREIKTKLENFQMKKVKTPVFSILRASTADTDKKPIS